MLKKSKNGLPIVEIVIEIEPMAISTEPVVEQKVPLPPEIVTASTKSYYFDNGNKREELPK